MGSWCSALRRHGINLLQGPSTGGTAQQLRMADALEVCLRCDRLRILLGRLIQVLPGFGALGLGLGIDGIRLEWH